MGCVTTSKVDPCMLVVREVHGRQHTGYQQLVLQQPVRISLFFWVPVLQLW